MYQNHISESEMIIQRTICSDGATENKLRKFTFPNPPFVFTSLASQENEALKASVFVELARHTKRLLCDARKLGLNTTISDLELKNEIDAFITSTRKTLFPKETIRLRVFCLKREFQLFLDRYDNPWKGMESINAITLRGERNTPEIKSHHMGTSLSARKQAESLAQQEALLVDKENIIREGAWSNLFWFDKDEKLYTTRTKILLGITREIILENFPCQLIDLKKDKFLTSAYSPFITQSTSGITRLGKIDNQEFKKIPAFDRVKEAYKKHILQAQCT